jgi:hypothetical protein
LRSRCWAWSTAGERSAAERAVAAPEGPNIQ